MFLLIYFLENADRRKWWLGKKVSVNDTNWNVAKARFLLGMLESFSMGLILVSDLKKGMVLACEVSNKHGNTLLEKGDTLSEKHIMLLKSWGITEADIEGFDRDQVEERERETLSMAVAESIEEDLKNLFPDFGDNPLMSELRRIVRKFKIKNQSPECSHADQ